MNLMTKIPSETSCTPPRNRMTTIVDVQPSSSVPKKTRNTKR